MKLGIMQPYFFPYLGYFALIKYADKWIIFDTVQYIEKGWANRNRIIHSNKAESMYFTVPVKAHAREVAFKDIKIVDDKKYIATILGQLAGSYKKRAPYFNEVYQLVLECLNHETNNLTMLNTYSLKRVCVYLGIELNYEIFSNMDITIDAVHDAGEWALNISKALQAKEYINPPGGVDLFDPGKFKENNIDLKFLNINIHPYDQRKNIFLDRLSIIDVMMFNSKEEINRMLDDYTLYEQGELIEIISNPPHPNWIVRSKPYGCSTSYYAAKAA
jgi:hypothetical protein